MLSMRTVKLIVYEMLQFACLCVPIFVLLERFASLMRFVRSEDTTAYWLVVAVSIAYVTTVTLFVWVPLKFFILKSRRFFTNITNWRPVPLAYVFLTTLPCFAILLASSKVQADTGILYDVFTELPVSLVLFALICVDIVERIRPYQLRGQGALPEGTGYLGAFRRIKQKHKNRRAAATDSLELDFELPGPVLTHLEHVSSVSGEPQLANGNENGSARSPENRARSVSGRWREVDAYSMSNSLRTAYHYSSHSHSSSRWFLGTRDPRYKLFLDSFMFWLDTAEMVRVAGLNEVFYSDWIFPIYILAFVSILRVVVTPNNPLLVAFGTLFQDLPFLVLRICLVGVFGFVTPLLYVMKNLLVCLAFVYFLFLTKLKVFNKGSMF